jgi:hypothetical protein
MIPRAASDTHSSKLEAIFIELFPETLDFVRREEFQEIPLPAYSFDYES